MLSLFYPQYEYQIITDITPEDIKKMGVLGLAVDIDNTTAYDNADILIDGVVEWVQAMRDSGIKMVIISNAKPDRCKKIAGLLGIEHYVFLAMKPFPFGYIRAARRLKLRLSEMAMAGDQLFTDIMGANLCGVKSIYVSPIEKEKRSVRSFALRRRLEGRILNIKSKKVSAVETDQER